MTIYQYKSFRSTDVSHILATSLLYFAGYFRSEFYPFSFPVGKSNVSIKCVSTMYEINKEITHDIRKSLSPFLPLSYVQMMSEAYSNGVKTSLKR